MHDFDAEGPRATRLHGDHTFKINGETFEFTPAVAPEALVRYADMNGNTEEQEAIEIIDETILAFLKPGQEDLWRHVRDRNAAHPITVTDLTNLVKWLVEEQTGRPTTPPSDSSHRSESGGSGTTSTGDLVSTPVAA